MNLTTKVLIAFTLVIGVALLTVSFMIDRSVNTAYWHYLSGFQRQRMTEYAVDAEQVYTETGSWLAVQSWLDQASAFPAQPGYRGGRAETSGQRQAGGGPLDTTRYIVVDTISGLPLAASEVEQVTVEQLAASVPIAGETNAVIVAIGNTTGGGGLAEQDLLDQIYRAIWVSALTAGTLALILGSLLVAGILRPLHKLETSVAQIAQGDLQSRVDIQGAGEISQLAENFNRMAENLQRQEELRQHLVADIAHELRTPLSVLQGNLQAILDGVFPLEQEEIRSVYDETRLLSRLVNDLHEMAQAEAGRLSLAKQTIVAGDVVAHIASSFRSLALSKNITVVADDPVSGLTVEADPDRLQQMLHNLVGNAVRHTPEGGCISLGAERAGDGRVRFWVQDNGQGIDAQVLPLVFDRFYRADPSRDRGADFADNTGLGLTIVKVLAQAHGGTVGVESKVGEGSRFWIELNSQA